jgi:hypothetical protein
VSVRSHLCSALLAGYLNESLRIELSPESPF